MTNQHGCGGNSKIECEIILQYACEDTSDARVDNFWPWVQSKGGASTAYYGAQHCRSDDNIGRVAGDFQVIVMGTYFCHGVSSSNGLHLLPGYISAMMKTHYFAPFLPAACSLMAWGSR